MTLSYSESFITIPQTLQLWRDCKLTELIFWLAMPYTHHKETSVQERRHGFFSGDKSSEVRPTYTQNILKIGKDIGFGPLHSRIGRGRPFLIFLRGTRPLRPPPRFWRPCINPTNTDKSWAPMSCLHAPVPPSPLGATRPHVPIRVCGCLTSRSEKKTYYSSTPVGDKKCFGNLFWDTTYLWRNKYLIEYLIEDWIARYCALEIDMDWIWISMDIRRYPFQAWIWMIWVPETWMPEQITIPVSVCK